MNPNKREYIYIVLIGLIIIFFIYIRYKPIEKYTNNKGDKIELVFDRWYSGRISHNPYDNTFGEMRFEPYYKVFYNNKTIFQFKLKIEPAENGFNRVSEHHCYADNDFFYMYINSCDLFLIKVPLNDKLNKINELEIEGYVIAKYTECKGNSKIYRFNDGTILLYCKQYSNKVAKKELLRFHLRDY